MTKSRREVRWRLLLGLLCLALVVLFSTVQVAHTHSSGDVSHTDCALCATAHVVAQVVTSPAPVPATCVVATVLESSPKTRCAPLSIFALFTRPPPSGLKLA